jgi:hypothetical protein
VARVRVDGLALGLADVLEHLLQSQVPKLILRLSPSASSSPGRRWSRPGAAGAFVVLRELADLQV